MFILFFSNHCNIPVSNILCMLCNSAVPSAPPDNENATDITTTSFVVLWEQPPPEHRNGIITHYRLKVENLCTHNTTYTTIQPSDVPYTVEHLTPYTTYNCSVRAATVNGTGNSTDETSITTDEDGQENYSLVPRLSGGEKSWYK